MPDSTTHRPIQFIVLFSVLALASFVLTGGLFASLLPNGSSSGLLNTSPGQPFVVSSDVNNMTSPEMAISSLVISVEIAAFATIFIWLVFLRVRSEAPNKASGRPAGSPS